jgi:uncharacterized protein YqgC (DUF456 family)
MTITLIILGLLLALVGLIGCLFPIIPGPPLSFLAILLLSYAKNWEPFSATFLMVTAGLALVVTLMDYVVSAIGAKRYGASKLGIAGSIVGMLVGILFIPPWGMLVGAIVGASLGELIAGKEGRAALKAGWGVFVGNVAGIFLKLTYTFVILYYYIKEMF